MKFFEYINLLAMAEMNAVAPAQFYRLYVKQGQQPKR